MDGLETEFWRSAAFIAAILWQGHLERLFLPQTASEAAFSEGSDLAQRMRIGRAVFPGKCRCRRVSLRP